MGFPLIATPTVALLLDIRVAITILIIPNIVMDVTQIFRGGFPFHVLRRFTWFLLMTVVGVFLGTKVLATLPLWILNLCLGVMVLVFVIFELASFRTYDLPKARKKAFRPRGTDRWIS